MIALIEHQHKRTDDAGLLFGRGAGSGIEWFEDREGFVQIQVDKFEDRLLHLEDSSFVERTVMEKFE